MQAQLRLPLPDDAPAIPPASSPALVDQLVRRPGVRLYSDELPDAPIGAVSGWRVLHFLASLGAVAGAAWFALTTFGRFM